MSLRSDIQSAQKQALIEKDSLRLDTLRMLWSGIRNEEIQKRVSDVGELNDEQVQTLIARQVKQLTDANLDYAKGGRTDLVEKTDKEIQVLTAYLPTALTDDELLAVVKQVIAENVNAGKSDIGRLTGAVMKEVKGKATGNRVREILSGLFAE